MRFLAAESCDFAVVRSPRANGHDVIAVSEVTPRAEDSEVIRLAVREKGILLTEDKDFGRLVYSRGQKTLGVIFLRFLTSVRKQIAKDVVKLVKRQGERLIGASSLSSLAEFVSPMSLENDTLTQGVIHK